MRSVLGVGILVAGVLILWSQGSPLFGTDVPKMMSSQNSSVTTILMTPEGFSPAEVEIKKGDTVEFINKDSSKRWPASNLHPSHAIYPEFDPREPLVPEQTWRFVFDKEGIWKFHDHLKPLFKGVITVK